MTVTFSCGHAALLDDEGCFLNGSHCTWQEYVVGPEEAGFADCYGNLCSECIPVRDATKFLPTVVPLARCKLGGEL